MDEIAELIPVLAAGKKLQKVLKKLGKGQNKERGPAHVWDWTALVRQLALSSKMLLPDKQILQKNAQTHKDVTVLKHEIPYCTVHKAYGQPKILVKVHVRTRTPALQIWES